MSDVDDAVANGWQVITMNGHVGFYRQFRLLNQHQRTLQIDRIVVLVDATGVRLYPLAKEMKLFIPKGKELVALGGESVNVEALSQYLARNSALTINAQYERCRDDRQKRQNTWLLASSELVMAKDFSFVDPRAHAPRPISVILHRNGVSLHGKTLKGRNPPCAKDCFLFIPSRILTAEILRRYFSVVEGAEILAVCKLNRDELLKCLPGGRTVAKAV